MPQEDDLLACLLDVAEAELKSLNRQENCNNQLKKNDDYISRNKNGKSFKDVDLFSCDTNQPESNSSTKYENPSLIHRGDTDSSDDECNRNYANKKYNESGDAIKSLLNHSESFYGRGNATQAKSTLSSSWKPKPKPQQTAVKKNSNSLKESSNVVSTDTMFGLRVINPVLSSKTLEERMVGRKVVPILHISKYLNTLNKSDDWVLAGVICNKGTTRTSAKGSQFMIWTLTDLLGDIKTVALFLFGSAYEQFWKTQVGCVVGVLNPSILDKRDGSKDEAALSVDNAQKLLILGQSKDLGTCKSTKKNGDKCTTIVNKSDCEYCIYHIKKEYQNCSRRSELQANFSGKGLIALRNKVLGKNEVFYAGKSYTAIPAKQSRKMVKKDKDRLQSLSGVATTSTIKKPTMKKAAASFDVHRGQRIKDMEILRKLGGNTDKFESNTTSNFQGNHSNEVTMDEAKANALKVLSRLQQTEEKISTETKMEKENRKTSHILTEMKNGKPNSVDSEQKSENSSKIDLLQKSLDEMIQTDFIDLDLDYKSMNKVPGSRTNTLNSIVDRTQKASPILDKNNSNKKKTSNKLCDNKSRESSLSSSTTKSSREPLDSNKATNSTQNGSSSTSSQSTSGPIFSQKLLGSTVPSLSSTDGFVDLSTPTLKKANKAKLNALKYIEKHGPLEKTDPNKSRGKGIKRNIDELNISGENSRKIQKIQENEFLSDRFKKMMEVQSKHMDLVELRDDEEKEKYFKKQEVKERLEEKMASTYKVECKAVRCLDCKYTNFSAAEKCKVEKHRLQYRNAMKRFFKCGNCGNRVACLDIIPIHPCKNCSDIRWERTTMMKEKNVTNAVNLSIRGGEQKFVNSVATDANLNLMVPDDS